MWWRLVSTKYDIFSYLSIGFGSRHTRQTHIVLGFSPQNFKFLPVNFHFKRVVFDLNGGLGLSNLVSKAPLLRYLPHLWQSNGLMSQHHYHKSVTVQCIICYYARTDLCRERGLLLYQTGCSIGLSCIDKHSLLVYNDSSIYTQLADE